MAKIIRSADDIDPTDKIELTVESSDGKSVTTCQSMVLDVTDEGVIISIPTANKVPVPLRKGTKVEASIWKHYAEHRFKTKVLARRKLKIPQLVLEKPAAATIDRTPLRKNYRVETRTTVQVRLHRVAQQDSMAGSTLDLSVGGCALQLPLAFKVGTELELELGLPYPPDEEGLPRTVRLPKILGIVQTVTSPSQLNSHLRVMGVSFINLEKTVQNDILRYVTFRQRELIRKREAGQTDSTEVPYYSARTRMTGASGKGKGTPASAEGKSSAPSSATEPQDTTSKNVPNQESIKTPQSKSDPKNQKLKKEKNQETIPPETVEETAQQKTTAPTQLQTPATPSASTQEQQSDEPTAKTPSQPLKEERQSTELTNNPLVSNTSQANPEATSNDDPIDSNEEAEQSKPEAERIKDLPPDMQAFVEAESAEDLPPLTEDAMVDTEASPEQTTEEPAEQTPEVNIEATPLVYDTQRFGPLKVVMPESNTFNGKTILVVDDDEGIRDIIADILVLNHYRVILAQNGQEGFDIARNVQIDLVITDLMMPEVNGWRLLALLKQNKIEVPVVIITGFMSKEGRDVLTNKEIAGFLVKPIRIEELLTLVRRVLFPEETTRKYRVLTVEDDEDTRMLIAAQLEKSGFIVSEAGDGIEALDKVDTFQPDLILLDIMMPRMDGFEVAKYLRARSATAEIPIFMLTVKTSPEYVKQAVTMKIEGYIIKPFDAKNLSQRIVNVLRNPNSDISIQSP